MVGVVVVGRVVVVVGRVVVVVGRVVVVVGRVVVVSAVVVVVALVVAVVERLVVVVVVVVVVAVVLVVVVAAVTEVVARVTGVVGVPEPGSFEVPLVVGFDPVDLVTGVVDDVAPPARSVVPTVEAVASDELVGVVVVVEVPSPDPAAAVGLVARLDERSSSMPGAPVVVVRCCTAWSAFWASVTVPASALALASVVVDVTGAVVTVLEGGAVLDGGTVLDEVVVVDRIAAGDVVDEAVVGGEVVVVTGSVVVVTGTVVGGTVVDVDVDVEGVGSALVGSTGNSSRRRRSTPSSKGRPSRSSPTASILVVSLAYSDTSRPSRAMTALTITICAPMSASSDRVSRRRSMNLHRSNRHRTEINGHDPMRTNVRSEPVEGSYGR